MIPELQMHRVKVIAQPKDKLPASHAVSVAAEGFIYHAEAPHFHASNAKDLEGGPGLASLSTVDCSTIRCCTFGPTNTSSELVSQQTLSHRETGCFVYDRNFLFDAESVGRQELPFRGLESLNVNLQTTTTGDAQLDHCELNMDDYLHPVAADHDFSDLLAMNVSHPAVPYRPSDVQLSEDLTHHVDATGSNTQMFPHFKKL